MKASKRYFVTIGIFLALVFSASLALGVSQFGKTERLSRAAGSYAVMGNRAVPAMREVSLEKLKSFKTKPINILNGKKGKVRQQNKRASRVTAQMKKFLEETLQKE
tara:strand:- start:54 stop:371 length:318 start_codon:yes stop_codon:yes gene_type:complete